VRIAVLGLGRIGAFHAQTLTSLDSVDKVLVTDPVDAAVQSVVASLGAVPYASIDELLDAAPDAVVIATPTPTHLDLLRAMVARGVPTFCEKPVAEDPYAATDLVEIVQRSDVPVQIGFPRRFDPAFLAAKTELDDGRLGWLTTVRSTTMDPAPPPAAYVAASGGIFRDCSIHDIDAVRWVTGRDIVEVYATGANRGDALFGEVDDVDTASVLLTLDDGTIGVVSNTRYNGAGYDVRLELHGSRGSIAAGFDEGLPLRSADADVLYPRGPAHTFFMDRFAAAFRRELATFVEVAARRCASPCSVADGMAASWVAEACARSRAEHRPIRMDELG
jgi:myo-inositol 2-dehydrogenase / D-chiro-inositol 1-dehydrogenase